MYKTIVVHLSSVSGMANTVQLAAGLANRSGAHLIGAASSGAAEFNYLLAVGAPVAVMPGNELDALRADAAARLQRFEDYCRELGVASFESRLFDQRAEEALLMQSRYCDLLVVSQHDVQDEGFLQPAQLNGALVSRAARPVLVVPASCRPDASFRRIMVAWNGSLGASRALAFGMPLLRAAARIYVAVANPDLERIDEGGEPGADLATYLARHHHNVELVQREGDAPADAVLADLARELDIDLMLTGAYGHGRLHDWVLGSTTQALVAQARVPLLMSH